MQPRDQQNQAGLPVAMQQAATGDLPVDHVATPVSLNMTEAMAAAYAKQIAEHYAGDPHELSEALADLKLHFQADHYNISPSAAEGK